MADRRRFGLEIKPGIHRITNRVSNFYLVEEAGEFLLVDAGIPRDWSRLLQALDALGRKPEDVRAVLLTHAHPDHTGFAEHVRSGSRAVVWVHAADADVARGAKPAAGEGKLRRYLFRAETWKTLIRLMMGGGTRIIPIREVSSFSDGQVIEVPGRPRAVHVPGHTSGMASLFFEGHGAVMTGDALVTKNPLTGRLGPQIMPDALNVDSAMALRSLDAIEQLPAPLVLPGHGDPWTQGAVQAVRLARTAGRS
jgi:glyoxylase-like metal-dependent hydrolase (beta-lactamase superfamily II)